MIWSSIKLLQYRNYFFLKKKGYLDDLHKRLEIFNTSAAYYLLINLKGNNYEAIKSTLSIDAILKSHHCSMLMAMKSSSVPYLEILHLYLKMTI